MNDTPCMAAGMPCAAREPRDADGELLAVLDGLAARDARGLPDLDRLAVGEAPGLVLELAVGEATGLAAGETMTAELLVADRLAVGEATGLAAAEVLGLVVGEAFGLAAAEGLAVATRDCEAVATRVGDGLAVACWPSGLHTHEASRAAGGWMTVYACASVRPRQVYTGTAVRPLDGRKVSKIHGTDTRGVCSHTSWLRTMGPANDLGEEEERARVRLRVWRLGWLGREV